MQQMGDRDRKPKQELKKRRPRFGIATAAYTAITLGWFAPILRAPHRIVLGHPHSDLWKHVWTLWHVRYWAAKGYFLPVNTPFLNAPNGGYLLDVNHFNGLLGLALFKDTNLLLTTNIILFLHLLATALSGYLLGWELTRRRSASFVLGAAYAFNPFFLGYAIGSGSHERAGGAVIALLLWCFIRILRRDDYPGYLLLFAVLAGIGAFVCVYYVLFAFLACALLILELLVPAIAGKQWKKIRHTLRRLAVLALLVIPCLLPYMKIVRKGSADNRIVRRPVAMFEEISSHPPDTVPIAHYLLPTREPESRVTLFQDRMIKIPYLGMTLILTAILSLIISPSERRRTLLVIIPSLLFLIVSFGPNPRWQDSPGEIGLATFASDLPSTVATVLSFPYYLFRVITPFFNAVNTLWHMAMLTILGLATATAMMLGSIRNHRSRSLISTLVLVLFQLETILCSGLPVPLPVSRTKVPDFYDIIRASPYPAIVLDLPMFRGDLHLSTGEYLYYQTLHHQPIPYTVNYFDHACDDLFRFFSLNWPCDPAGDNRDSDFSSFQRAVEENGIRWIVLHRRFLSRQPGMESHFTAHLQVRYGPAILENQEHLLFYVGPD